MPRTYGSPTRSKSYRRGKRRARPARIQRRSIMAARVYRWSMERLFWRPLKAKAPRLASIARVIARAL